MPIGWNGLSIPIEGCSVCMLIVITNFKVRSVEQNSTPDLKLVMTMGMQTEHPSVGMLTPFQPTGMHIEQ